MAGTELDELEAEAIWAIREATFAFERPVLLYSIGKDSTVLLELVRKAFAPGPIPVTVLHVDTGWKFAEMIKFRDEAERRLNLKMIKHSNPDVISLGLSPFDLDSSEYTRVAKTAALKQALDAGGFDVALGGARRDEEKSRAKERMFSLRGPNHTWAPNNQRPEFWWSVNSELRDGQSMRVFPISNWTEIDVWRYIQREKLEVVPLYFSKSRPTVLRDGKIIVVDDDRFQFLPGEAPVNRTVRFRTLGCYPLSAAEPSDANSVEDVIDELKRSGTSERAGRLIDGAGADSMERKKLEGYF